MLHLQQGSTVSDLSNDSSPEHGYPDFPPSPDDSWLGTENNNNNGSNNNNNNNATTSTSNSNSTNNQSSSHY